jgi:8-oxo-dGTP pyrophosphatase MutT (NUDIX family)
MRRVANGDVRDAATVVVLRHGSPGMQVLLLRRHADSGFVPRAWVFPGGVIDEADCVLPAARWRGIEPEALAERFGMPPARVLGMHVGAVRETFEEAGLLLATDEQGVPPDLDQHALADVRRELEGTGDAFGRWLAERRLVLDLGELVYWSRWITPEGSPRRYDTCFFLARAVAGQVADHDGVETTAQRWFTPQEALTSDLQIIYPTKHTLQDLAAFDDVDAVFAYGRRRSEVRINQPRLRRTADGRVVPTLEEEP